MTDDDTLDQLADIGIGFGEPRRDPDMIAQRLVGEVKVINQALADAAAGTLRRGQIDVARQTLAALPEKFRAAANTRMERT